MIVEPGDPDRDVPVAESFHEQTDDELNEKEANRKAYESFDMNKVLEYENEGLLRAVVSQDIMSIVQNNPIVDTSNLQTELERTKEKFKSCVIKKENEYAKLWNDWVDNVVPNKLVKESIRTKLIINSQSHVITKKNVKIDSNDLSSTGVDNTAKTRRPHPRSNTKNNRVMAIFSGGIFCLQGFILVKALDTTYSQVMAIFSGGIFCLQGFILVKALDTTYSQVAFRRNTCFIKNLEGADLWKGKRTTNLYSINLHDMASTSPICLMARATSTKSSLWHQRLFYLYFDTIHELVRNDLVTGLPKFKYSKSIFVLHAQPTEKHLKEVRRIFCYLRGTINIGLWHTKNSGFGLTGFSYADHAGTQL
nr:retrovirus-related Pol polyprotein from transposon TNT 1-94 [Tanacetum cinerariifolium]